MQTIRDFLSNFNAGLAEYESTKRLWLNGLSYLKSVQWFDGLLYIIDTLNTCNKRWSALIFRLW